MKAVQTTTLYWLICLAPQGASGLKAFCEKFSQYKGLSRPARGEWIESPDLYISCAPVGVSPRKGRVD